MQTLSEYVLKGETLIVAHRGSSGNAPENTMAAFKKALIAGADMIETDVQMTADDYVVIFHDADVKRTTNGGGLLGSKKLDELRKLDAGSWFSPEFKGEKIPLLSELIELSIGNTYLNIEIKNRRTYDISNRLEKLLKVIYDYDFQKYTLFTSFDHRLIARIKLIDSSLHTGIIAMPGDNRLPSEIVFDIGADAYITSLDEINEAKSSDAHKNGIFLGVYSIDTDEDLKKIENYNIQAIVTNFPDRIKTLIIR
jgi:glycerophosphoryl diester phosphodiesterase